MAFTMNAYTCLQGAFDSDLHQHLPRTKYDIQIDETSNKPGEQAFEKMISGRYLGEVFRLVIMELIDEGAMFLGQNTYKLEDPYSLDTAFLSLMESLVHFICRLGCAFDCYDSDPTDELLTIIGIFNHFYNLETTLEERKFFRALARLIGRRAARLSACGIAAIVRKKGYLEEGCEVGADGSLYNVRCVLHNPRMKQHLIKSIEISWVCAANSPGPRGYSRGEGNVSCHNLSSCSASNVPKSKIVTYHAEDGSGAGSAIIAGTLLATADHL